METRAEWMIAAQESFFDFQLLKLCLKFLKTQKACFAHNIQIVTVYATLGEKAVAAALEEAEIEVIITSASLVETKMAGILKASPNIKTVIYAPFENRHKMLQKSDLGVQLYTFQGQADSIIVV